MTFADIPAGVAVFLDANVLVYYFSSHALLGPACKDLLRRVARRDVSAYTSAHVLSNMAHRLMTLEAMGRFGWPAAGIARRLGRRPEELRQLIGYRQAIDDVSVFGAEVLPITASLVSAAAAISQQHGLLSGDALIVAVMQEHGLVNLVSHDADFDRVPGLTRYAPV